MKCRGALKQIHETAAFLVIGKRINHHGARPQSAKSYDAPELGLEVAAALHHLYPDEYKLAAIDGLMRNKASLDAVMAGEDPRRIAEDWQDELDKFKVLRAKYLLY